LGNKKVNASYVALLIISLLFMHGTAEASESAGTTGMVVDFFTGKPIEGAIVTVNNYVVLTNTDGMFFAKTDGCQIAVRAYGYLKAEPDMSSSLASSSFTTCPLIIRLVPFTPKALYLSFYGIGSRIIRDSALRIISETELNSLVIDVKGDRGMVSFRSSIPLASRIGAQKIITVKDIKGLIKSLKEKGIYTIARIVVFKDDLLARARPDLAVKTAGGAIWRDREELAWIDPSKREAWDYNISLAVEAAESGFDEIQFDYVRFPDAPGLRFSVPYTEENRVGAISGFLAEARKRLLPYNVFLAADLFGYVSWNTDDTKIGQKLEEVTPILDYISPMLYPSGFKFGIPGYRIPVEHSYEIVYLSLKKAQNRTHLPPLRFRPWLQAFRDYAFDKRQFNGEEIREQINAAEKFGSNGWMLWNPRNIYTADGLEKENNAPPVQ
jgi:hypothetical protein